MVEDRQLVPFYSRFSVLLFSPVSSRVMFSPIPVIMSLKMVVLILEDSLPLTFKVWGKREHRIDDHL